MDSIYNEEALLVIVRERQATLRGDRNKLRRVMWQPQISLLRPIKRWLASIKQGLRHLRADDNHDDTASGLTQQRQYT